MILITIQLYYRVAQMYISTLVVFYRKPYFQHIIANLRSVTINVIGATHVTKLSM